jgi:hypothetical protein
LLGTRAGSAEARPDDLERAVEVLREACNLTARQDPAVLFNLGEALVARYLQDGAPAEVEEAVAAYRAAASLPFDDRSVDLRPEAISAALAAAYWHRYERLGTVADLNTAITGLERTIAGLDEDDTFRLTLQPNLATMLASRFERLGDVADLDRGIALYQRTMERLPNDDIEHRPQILNGLGAGLRVRFRRLGDPADIDLALNCLQEAAATNRGANKADALHNLSTALSAKANHGGDLADLDAAVDAGRAALEYVTPQRRATHLDSLGHVLLDRYERVGSLDDLDDAIAAGSDAVTVALAGDPDRPRKVSHLGELYYHRFERLKRPEDAEAAIRYGRESVDLTPADHYEFSGYLLALGNTMWHLREALPDRVDPDELAGIARRALDATPRDSSERPVVLNLLGGALLVRYRATGNDSDLDESVAVGREGLETEPAAGTIRFALLNNLANALQVRHEHRGADSDATEAIKTYAAAFADRTAAPMQRVLVAASGARRLADAEPMRAAALLESAVRLLPEVTPRRLHRLSQQERLSGTGFLAANAAALIMADPSRPEADRPRQALEILESGRAVLLSQALETRDDLTVLGEKHPGVAERFEQLRDVLDIPSTTGQDRIRMAGELADVLRHIRGLPGFTTFGLPPDSEELLREAGQGPVVTINVGFDRADALLLTADGITALHLPGLTAETLFDHVVIFQVALDDSLRTGATVEELREPVRRVNQVLRWLWDTVTGPVLDELGFPPCPGDRPPRVWWALSGLLSLLPLHAAGYHGEDGARTVLDRVVSSYTPTIRALAYARRRAAVPADTDRSLIVAMPTTPGLPTADLRYAGREAAAVAELLPGATTLPEPRREVVLTELAGCAFAHFACHGVVDTDDPSQSRLLLHDHRTDPFTVASLAVARPRNARIAYLAACRTAFHLKFGLLDEAIHLTGAFQLAGFPYVVGTFWEISDQRSVDVATDFYRGLAAGGTLRPEESAFALHRVVRARRDENPLVPPVWAAYLHAGA